VSPRERVYLFGQSCVGAAIANAAINYGLGLAATRGFATFPLWRVPGVAADLVGTAFGVTFGTCVFMAIQIPWDLRRGKIAPIASLPTQLSAVVARFPRGTLRRGFSLGLLSVPVFALPVVVALALVGAPGMESARFVGLKASFAALEGAVVTPLLVLAAIADAVRTGGAGVTPPK
jgi:hypothetical protein